MKNPKAQSLPLIVENSKRKKA